MSVVLRWCRRRYSPSLYVSQKGCISWINDEAGPQGVPRAFSLPHLPHMLRLVPPPLRISEQRHPARVGLNSASVHPDRHFLECWRLQRSNASVVGDYDCCPAGRIYTRASRNSSNFFPAWLYKNELHQRKFIGELVPSGKGKRSRPERNRLPVLSSHFTAARPGGEEGLASGKLLLFHASLLN